MFGNDWDDVLQAEMSSPYFIDLQQKIANEYDQYNIFPPKECIYEALRLTSFTATKAVILGQDPYHGAGQAHGLSFSVAQGVRIPPSLRNIYKELNSDLSVDIPNHGSLKHWAREGVLMLNTVLTVQEAQPASHEGMGWEAFTDTIIQKLNERDNRLVFILWGSHAQKKTSLIDMDKHKVIQSSHPSPLAAYRGFLGSKPFSQTNAYLESMGREPIDWAIPQSTISSILSEKNNL
ncbi:uracil-DNA glycosylase [Paenibacillus macquariensis]|uniref:Uracil-DNA glycosylase n=1 Tax=Paenibacillus macquariensis TaxID=948756 RepID=A0ABY1JLE3_9BACL|nr:uracil-DNA glycosylase [Paenibacillus macquariensis]MEC0090130.1 uracil-DNA glycosylase [Paenibacillus macquariensis]OAB31001.1 uracil-DNA glycosylase [Paenibacillus macquariensis subsp. macquariensis]SIQ38238.1 Uracil-DNA glycosylase [Paenibacillus macquariensis]